MVTTAAASPLEGEEVDEEVEFFASSSALLCSGPPLSEVLPFLFSPSSSSSLNGFFHSVPPG